MNRKTPADELSRSYLATLEAAGLNRDTDRRCQHLAKVPEAGFRFSLDVTCKKQITPIRIGIIKWGHTCGGAMGFVQQLADYVGKMCWPDLREAPEILWQALKREYVWVQPRLAEKAMSRATAKKLFHEVEGQIYNQEMDAAEAR